MKLIAAILVIATLAGSASAFWGKGHLLVARIAYDVLTQKSPSTLTNVNSVLNVLAVTDAAWTKKEGDHPMVECATFADDIKNKGGRYQQGWHFIDIPYLDDPGSKISDFNFTFDEHNITQAIGGITKWFNRESGYTDEYAYQQIMQHRYNCSDESCALSTAMRLLIHYCGDIHQPLHCASRVDSKYPQGDRGGNSVPIPSKPGTGVDELHAVWDSILYEEVGYANLPFTAADWASYGTRASALVATYPMSDAVIRDLDPTHWAQESFNISKTFVYKGVKENEAVSEAYIAAGRKLAEKQIVIGGHRLANLLMSFPLGEWLQQFNGGAAQSDPITLKKMLIQKLFATQHANFLK